MFQVKLEANELEPRETEVIHLEEQKQSLESVIDQWIKKQPSWYSAALHIVLQGAFTDRQVEALAAAACKESGIDLGIQGNVQLVDYQSADLGGESSSQRVVLLESVTAESGINAIEPGSKLNLGTSGITVIYGNNGSGKSGFSRILRNACTSRSGSSEILSNVFEDNGLPSAAFDVNIDGTSMSFAWKDGDSSYPAFPEVAFFDAACAAIEVGNKDNAMLYMPGVISSLMRMTDLISAVAAQLQTRESELTESLNMGLVPFELRRLSRVETLLSCALENEAIRLVNAALLSPQDESRRRALPKLIDSDPDVEVPKVERRRSQLAAMRQRLVDLYKCCQPKFSGEYESAQDAVRKATEAAKAATVLASDNSELNGFGSDAWKSLWEAARLYSDSLAYTDVAFPKLQEDSLCPLCQQSLGEAALSRMRCFEDYVTGVAEKNLTEKRKLLGSLTNRFVSAVDAVKSDKAGISVLATDQARSSMDSLVSELESIATAPDPNALIKLSGLIELAGTQVKGELDGLDQRLESLRANQQPGNANKLKAELEELNGRAWISDNKDILIADAKKREQRNAIESVRKKCSTRQVSTLVSEASQVEVVERVQAAFVDELDKLKASGQQVAISTRVRAGQEYQRIALEGTVASPRNVLSEGEQKIVALAGFFALVDVMPGDSSVVLDDPITSLDHRWRKAVAARIVEAAKSHPVIVFTHEPVFCVEISELSAQREVPVTYRTVQRRGAIAGVVLNELDWDASNVKQRVKLLRNKATDIGRRYKGGEIKTDAELGRKVRDCYSDLRTTWERAVESVLLNGVVKRFERPVHTKPLRRLSDITDDDIRIVEENMTKCSLLTNAHDDPPAPPDELPTIQEFEADVDVLENWRKAIEMRRKKS